jgi:hypothetical protein
VTAAGAVTGLAGAFFLHYFGFVLTKWDNPHLEVLTFPEYLDFRCALGSTIGSIELGYTGTAIYWSLEALLIVVLAAVVARWPLGRPFCTACNAWKSPSPLGTFRIGSVQALQALAAGQPAAMAVPGASDERVTIAIYRCPGCDTAGGIEVQVTCVRGSGEQARSATLCVCYPGEAARDFDEVARSCREQGLAVKA